MAFLARNDGFSPTRNPRDSHVMYATTASTSLDDGVGWSTPSWRRGILAAIEAVDDAIRQADQPAGPRVRLRKHAGDADNRQPALSLSRVQVAVCAGNLRARKPRRLVRGVDEYLVSPADLFTDR